MLLRRTIAFLALLIAVPSQLAASEAVLSEFFRSWTMTRRGADDMSLKINDFKVYMPAKDFEQSKRFYAALGFTMSEGWGGTADFELNGFRFRLQDYYVKDWADNFMAVMGVDDVDAWHRHVRKIAGSGEFANVRLKPPESVGDSLVLHVVDPSGVLLVFVQ